MNCPRDVVSQTRIQKIKESFKKIDVEGTGTIALQTIVDFLKDEFGLPEGVLQLYNLFEEDDISEGYINFSKFSNMMAYHVFPLIEEQEILNALQVFDENNNGYLLAEELRTALLFFGDRLTDEEVDEVLKDADVDFNGKINYKVFVRCVLKM